MAGVLTTGDACLLSASEKRRNALWENIRGKRDSITPAYLVETQHGEWINAYPEIEPNPMFMYGICSVCGFEQSVSDKLDYCPNCGAKMDGGVNDAAD